MFKHSAFIENTQEAREWLKELRYDEFENFPYRKNDEFLFAMNNVYKSKAMTCSIRNAPNIYIDCSGNFPLFKAITAVRNDNDYMQWFRCINDDDIPTFTLCTDKKCGFPIRFKKATPEELIEYFKNK